MRSGNVWLQSVLVLVLALSACGDDESGGGGGADGGGSGGSSGSGGNTPDGSAPTGLDDNTAGKACTNASDCGGGMCATTITSTMVGAAPEPAPGGYCTATCMMDSECGAGGACIGALPGILAGTCLDICTENTDCRDGYICTGGLMVGTLTIPDTCRPKPETDQLDDDVAGTACEANEDCPGGECLTSRMSLGGAIEQPGGYCSGACLEDSHCGAGGLCLPSILGGAGSCYESCATDTDCTRDGYRCRPLGGDLRGCNPAADPLPGNTAGKACASDADCGGTEGTCASELPVAGVEGLFGEALAAPGGYCSQPCIEDIDCGAGGVCSGSAFGGVCFATCNTTDDCRAGYLCEERSMGGDDPDAGMVTLNVCAPEPTEADGGT